MELELLNLLEQDDTPVGHKFDNVPLSHVLTNYFGGKREAARNYLEKKNEEFTLWRLRYYSSKEMKDEVEDGIEKTKGEMEAWLLKLEEQQELRENNEWEGWEIAYALFDYLCYQEQLDKETDDVYSMFYDGSDNLSDDLELFTVKDREWGICLESDVDEIGKAYVKNMVESEGWQFFNKEWLVNHIDGEAVADDFDFDYDVRENPDVYLDETTDRELSDEQKSEIEEKENQIETLQEEQSELDTDTPEGEERYEEIETEISNLEDEIETIRESPEGDWDEEAIERVIEEKKEEVENNPVSYLNDMGIEDYSKYIDEEEAIDDCISTDGAVHFMSTYDGERRDHTYNGVDYVIIRRR
jgi:hypothetical protein